MSKIAKLGSAIMFTGVIGGGLIFLKRVLAGSDHASVVETTDTALLIAILMIVGGLILNRIFSSKE